MDINPRLQLKTGIQGKRQIWGMGEETITQCKLCVKGSSTCANHCAYIWGQADSFRKLGCSILGTTKRKMNVPEI